MPRADALLLRAWLAAARVRRRVGRPRPVALERIIAAQAPGRSFLDVGCMWNVDGRYAFGAEDAGATRVTGIDVEAPTDRYVEEHERRGSALRFVRGDLHDPAVLAEAGAHDVCFCAGVLYHAPHPLQTLERLRSVTRETLVLSTAALPDVPGLSGGLVFYPGLEDPARRAFATVIGGHATGLDEPFAPEAGYANWFWGITPSALRGLLHASGFRVVRFAPSPFQVVAIAVPADPAPGRLGRMATTTRSATGAPDDDEDRSSAHPTRNEPADDEHRTIAPIVGPDDPRVFTDSGIEVAELYTEADLPQPLELGEPGEHPYTRGVHREMYRKQLWTMRQYAGYASAKESNERYKYLIDKGSTGLSMAFDLPTQLGLDSDDPRCLGEVGRTGVAIDSLADMRTAFDGIDLSQVSTSMTINAPASVLLLLYQLVGEEQGVEPAQLRGTTQNDILKEYVARGNFIYPPEGSMRLTTDLFAYCAEHVPRWNTISISGYHFREKGCSAVQEVAFTLGDGIAYVQAALDAGLAVDDFAPRLAFFFNCHNNVFQEVAKFRAARRMWAQIMVERFDAQDPRSLRLRFHTQTGGVTLTAQQPENNIARVALQGFAAVSGGTQSLHTNGFDEALALPTERAARIALRTQQILAYEAGAADTVDPFAGSFYVESLTDEIEARALELIAKVDELGGAVNAVPFMTKEIDESAFGYHERYRLEQDIVVGVNKYNESKDLEVPETLKIDPDSERAQVQRLTAFKADRDQELVQRRLEEVRDAARGSDNLLPPLRLALKDSCSMGEVCAAMRDVFGEYVPEL